MTSTRDVIAGVAVNFLGNHFYCYLTDEQALEFADALIAAGVSVPECGGQCCTHVTGDDDG